MRKIAVFLIALAFVACGKSAVPNSGPLAPPATPPAQTTTTANGTINGGGGVGLRCGDKLEMLDVFEAREAGLTFGTLTNQDEAVRLVSMRIADHYWNPETIPQAKHRALIASTLVAQIFEGRSFRNAASNRDENVTYVDSLPLSNDFGNYKIPSGCSLEQIAFFSDEKTQLSIVKAAWNKLDWLSKSVLVAHELVYMIDRREGLNGLLPGGAIATSESTRRFVGLLLSSVKIPSKSEGLPTGKQIQRCSSNGDDEKTATYFYAFKQPKTGFMSLVFKTVLGRTSFYQLRADFPDRRAFAEIKAHGSDQKTFIDVKFENQNTKEKKLTFAYRHGNLREQIGETQSVSCEPL